MSAVLRKILLWLAMLVLPVHSFAAVDMGLTHASGHGVMQMTMNAPMGLHSRSASTVMGPHGTKDCAGVLADCGDAHGAGALGCHLAAACGLVAVPAPLVPAFLQHLSSALPDIPRSNVRIAFFTGAPDRPPRALA